jgi:hypothetical protein
MSDARPALGSRKLTGKDALAFDRPLKLRPNDRQGHRRKRNDVSSAALHAPRGDFETSAGRVVDVRQLANFEAGDFAGPHSDEHQKTQRRDRPVAVEG